MLEARPTPPGSAYRSTVVTPLQSFLSPGRNSLSFQAEYSKSRQGGIIRSASPIYDTRGDNFMRGTLHLSFLLFPIRPFNSSRTDATFTESTKRSTLRFSSFFGAKKGGRRRSLCEREDNGRRNCDWSDKTNGDHSRYGTVIVPPRLSTCVCFRGANNVQQLIVNFFLLFLSFL